MNINKSVFTTKQIAVSAVCIALASILSMISLYKMPLGGSVTPFSMLFICMPGLLFGWKLGLSSAFTYGVIQFIMDPYILSIPQVIFDYILAFTSLGLGALAAKGKYAYSKGYLLGICARWIFASLAGYMFWASYTPENWNPIAYVLAYNGAYIFTEGIITLIVMQIKPVKNMMDMVKMMYSK